MAKPHISVLAVVAVLVACCLIIAYEELAGYRSRATCIGLSTSELSYDNIHIYNYASTTANGDKQITIVYFGIVPLSQYRCTITIHDNKVEHHEASHYWSR
jgi:hypothetical protein